MIGRAIILFCLIASISSLNFNLLKSQVQSNSQWTRVKIHVENGIEPLTFSYTFLPVGWKQVRNYVYIPKTVFFNDMKYPCRLIVRD